MADCESCLTDPNDPRIYLKPSYKQKIPDDKPNQDGQARKPNNRRRPPRKRPVKKNDAASEEKASADPKTVTKDQTTVAGSAASKSAAEPEPVVEKKEETTNNNNTTSDEVANGSDGDKKPAPKKKNNRKKKNKANSTNNNKNKENEVKDELSKKWGYHKETESQKFRIFTDEDGTIMLELLDYNINSILQSETQWDCLYNNKPKISVYEFLDLLPRLKKIIVDNDTGYDVVGLKMIVEYVDHVFEEVLAAYEKMTQSGVISYSGLGYFFRKDSKVYVVDSVMEEKIAFTIVRSEYVRGFMSYFRITGHSIRTDGKKPIKCLETYTIGAYKGVRKYTDLPVKPVTDEIAKELTERGKTFKKYAVGNYYLHLTGNMFQESWWRPVLFKAHGRVMIDGASFRRFNPNYQLPSETEEKIDEIAEEELWRTYPYLYGFSFVAKKWGEIPVSQLTEINFDDTAFEKLVLPAEKKKLISALVKFQDRAFTDIITGKGGGCIFLLHGSPGVGKTLTAESLAELMHKPLYSVTVGELGTTTDSLEENLSKVLELAATWKAVILLDEADIFLEERSKNDIARNAMVGIFLRLLEYHQGVLFLTTNRVKNFDPAFHSRISVALKYHDLDTEAREQIWANLLSAAKIEGINAKDFGQYEINGRQIKNSIRLAQALAASEDRPVTKEFLLQTIEVARQFQTDLLESIVTREAHDVVVQKAIEEGVKEEASKLRVSNEMPSLRKSVNLDKK